MLRVGLTAGVEVLKKMHAEGMGPYQHDMIKANQDHPLGGFNFFDLVGFPRIQELESLFLSRSDDRMTGSIGGHDPRDSRGIRRQAPVFPVNLR